MAYGLFLYKEIESKSGKIIRLEIFQNSYTGASAEIEEVGPNPFILTTDNVNNEIYTPIVKTNLLIDIIDTEQLDYSIFFTPDATKFKVILKVDGATEWSGYLTPDNYTQNESYRSSIQLVARDNLGMLAEFDYDGTALPVKISTLLSAGFAKISFTSTLEYRVKKVDSSDETILNGIVVGRFFYGKTWYDAISEVLKGIGCQLRYVGANNYAVFDIADLKGYGDTTTSQDFKFIEQSGVTEIIPAWKSIDVVQDFALQESIYEGAIPTDEFSFLDQRNAGIPRTGIGRPLPPVGLQYDHIVNYYTIPIGARWTSTIPLLEPTFFEKPATSILLTGTEVESLIGVGKLSYTRLLPATERGTSLSVKFNCAKLLQGAMAERTLAGELFLTGVKTAGTLHFRCNFFFDDGTTEFYLSSAGWREIPVGYNDYFDIKLEITDPNTNPNVWYQELEFNLGYVESNGTLTMEIYPYWLDNNYLELNVDSYVLELKDFDILFSSANNLIGGVESGTIINSNHNIAATIDLPIGQVPFYLGNNLTMIAGIFKNTSYYPPMYNFHRPSGANYKLYELIGREIAHHYKTQRKKLSGNIINSDTFAAMPSFAKPFYDGEKYYALNYGSLDFRSEVMSVELIEVEDYETEDYTFVEATIDTGGSSLGSGDTEFIQWSAAGNAKRIYELDTASEAETAGSYAVIDKLGMSAAKKVPLFTLLDQKEDLLPATPSDPESKFLNGNREWSLINLGSGGNSPKVYFTSLASDVSGYKVLSYEPEATTSYCTTILTNEEELCNVFLYPLGVGVELLDAGTWEFDIYAKVSGTAGNVTMRAEVFKRTTGGVESVLFSKSSDIINNTDYEYIKFIYTSPSIPVDSTDRIGVKVYGKNTIAAAITLTWALGDGDASFFVTPLAMRHSQLRGKNDEVGFQHITQGNQTFEGIKTFSGAFTDMVENRNTNLRIPKVAPTSPTADEVYLYSLDSGFSGELPSGAGSVTSIALTMPTGFSVSGSPITESGTFGVTFASGYFLPTTTQFASKADVSLIGAANGIAPLDSGGKVALQYLPSTLLKYMGVWDASTNTPTLTSPDTNRKGQVWNVSVAGTQFGIAFKLGDWLIYNDSGVAEKSDNSDDVVSVNGYTGAVTLKTSDIAEQTNLYYTDARVKAYADTLYTPLAHASATNNPHSVTAAQVGALALTGGTMANTNLVSNLNADLLDGQHRGVINHFVSSRDFPLGTLITTNIDYSQVSGDSFYAEIKGNTYFRNGSCFTQIQGYIYDNTIISYSVTHLGKNNISDLVALNVGGVLCFWFPNQGYWEGYNVWVNTSDNINRVVSVENSAKPSGTKEVNLSSNSYITFNSANSNSTSFNWSAAKLTSTTLLLPQVAPTLTSGEMAIYGLESGFSGELPSGAGSVTSISMVVPTGLFVTPATITESGTFTISYASGYQMMTSTESSKLAGIEANANNYTLPTATNLVLGGVKIGTNVTITDGVISVHNPITLGTANGLSLSTQVLSLGLASTSTNGALSSTDWNTFNNKQAKLVGTGASSLVRVNTLGTITYDDSTYLTGNQTITLSGIITGSGTTAITTAIADGALSIAKTNGLQTALDGKLSTTGKAADSELLDGHDSTYFQVALTNPVTGAGTSGNIPQFTGTTTIGDSPIFVSGSNVCIGGTEVYEKLGVMRSGSGNIARFSNTDLKGLLIALDVSGHAVIKGTSSGQDLILQTGASDRSVIISAAALQMTENINTNLRIPKVAPTSPTSGEYYFYIVE